MANSMLVSSGEVSAAPFAAGHFAAGSVVVSQGGTIFGTGGSGTGTTVEANGAVDVYAPNSHGDMAPEASFTKGMYGPVAMAFDPRGDLWVSNQNTSTLVELTKAQLAKHNPMPAVTITAATPGALASPFGMAFDRRGDLWVTSNQLSRVYEYTKRQLARSGSPRPLTTISGVFATPPLGDGFDPSGDLWVVTGTSMLEFSKAELAIANPNPTVTISSTGGANISFTPSGNLWMVTGGGPLDDCFGTPCNNELVEFTRAQLSTSGSPTPAVTIKSTEIGAAGSMWGPYGVAINPSGSLWVANFFKPTAVEFGRRQLSDSGSPAPRRTIVGADTGMNWPSYVLIAP
jgi:streptogramin lyase